MCDHTGWCDHFTCFFLDGRSPVSHPTCEVPFPPRRSGEYRKGMIPARVVPGRLWICLHPACKARPEYARRRGHAVPAQETRFSAYGSRVRATPATRSRPVHMDRDPFSESLTPRANSKQPLHEFEKVSLNSLQAYPRRHETLSLC